LNFPRHFPYPLIGEDGDFSTAVSSEKGSDLFLKGHFGNHTASGKVRYRGRYRSSGRCQTEWQRWSLVKP